MATKLPTRRRTSLAPRKEKRGLGASEIALAPDALPPWTIRLPPICRLVLVADTRLAGALSAATVRLPGVFTLSVPAAVAPWTRMLGPARLSVFVALRLPPVWLKPLVAPRLPVIDTVPADWLNAPKLTVPV